MTLKIKILRPLVFTILLASSSSFACDSILKAKAKSEGRSSSFHKDCKIQDRFQKIRTKFSELGINVNDIYEYKALRFIERFTWEQEKIKQTPLEYIYEPAPETWQVWESGINRLTKNKSPNFLLSENFNTNYYIDLNLNLINDRIDNAPDYYGVRPGVYRRKGQPTTYCQDFDSRILQNTLSVERSNKEMAANWERKNNVNFKQIVKSMGYTDSFENAQIGAQMSAVVGTCQNKDNKVLLSYVDPQWVIPQISWLSSFLKYNLQQYWRGNPTMAPIELSAMIQRWFVSIHPFTDGNGRTSRALQELILLNYDMPFAPAGDLQHDSQVTYNEYIEATYRSIEKSLDTLEGCLKEHKKGKAISYKCKI